MSDQANGNGLAFDDDFGWIEVCIKVGDIEVTQRLDVMLVQKNLTDLARRFEKSPNRDFYAAVQEYMQELGFPQVSTLTAERFTDRIIGAVENLRKKVDGSPASSASTG